MALEMAGQDLYLRHIDGDGRSHIVEHRVWDAAAFITSLQRACNKVNEQEPNPLKRQNAVVMVSREQYLKEHKRDR